MLAPSGVRYRGVPLYFPPPPTLYMCTSVHKNSLSLVSAGIPAALAGKIHWIYEALEERGEVENSIVTRRFLEGTLVKEEVEKRAGDW